MHLIIVRGWTKCQTLEKKAEMQAWLENRSIAFEEDMVKAELLAIVKENAPQQRYL